MLKKSLWCNFLFYLFVQGLDFDLQTTSNPFLNPNYPAYAK